MSLLSNFFKKLSHEAKFYLRIFYDPSLYRDIAFRSSGYGLKKVYMTLFLLMLPSLIILNVNLIHKYNDSWLEAISKLPNLKLQKGQLIKNQQTKTALSQIDNHQFEWVNESQIRPELFDPKKIKPFLLGLDYLWVNFPRGHYFGWNLDKDINYYPVIIWSSFKEQVSSLDILRVFNLKFLIIYSIFLGVLMYAINCLYIFIFIRSFAFLAKKMVLMVLKDSIEYDVACRLLSISMISTLIVFALIVAIKGYTPNIKFILITVYMFNFYIALRCIKAKSEFRWLSGIK